MREEDTLESQLLQVEARIAALNSSQPISRRSIINYRTFSSNLYDNYFQIYETNNIRYFRITFDHETAKSGALLRLNVYARANNENVMAAPLPYMAPTAPALSVRWRKLLPTSGSRTEWMVVVYKGQAGISYYDAYFKYYIEGTDTGTVTITNL